MKELCPKCKVYLSSDGYEWYCSICGFSKPIKQRGLKWKERD